MDDPICSADSCSSDEGSADADVAAVLTASAAIDLSVAGFTSGLSRADADAEAAAMDMSEATATEDEGDVEDTAEDEAACRADWTRPALLELDGCCCRRLFSIEGSEEFTW